MQILVDKMIINCIYLKYEQITGQAVDTSIFLFWKQHEQAKPFELIQKTWITLQSTLFLEHFLQSFALYSSS